MPSAGVCFLLAVGTHSNDGDEVCVPRKALFLEGAEIIFLLILCAVGWGGIILHYCGSRYIHTTSYSTDVITFYVYTVGLLTLNTIIIIETHFFV